MRLFILIQLLNVACGCVDSWKKLPVYRCLDEKVFDSEIRCYITEKLSYAEITRDYFSVFCNNEIIDRQLMRCLEVNSTNEVHILYCHLSEFDVGQFVSGVKVVEVDVNLTPTIKNNFDSATFNDIPTLKTITLTGLRTSGVLNVTFENVPSVADLNIENYEFWSFIPRPFQNLSSLLTLSLKNGVLETLPSQVFQGLYNLKGLNLSYNQIKEIDPLLLKNLTQLQVLDLSGNKLTNLPNDLFSDLSNLTSFSVKKNRLTALPDNLFAACSKLEYFFVSNNQIGQFPSGFFAGLRNLKYFFAMNCSLTHLERGIFSDATNLRVVALTTNQIVNLPPDLFKNSKNLEVFFIGVNKIQYLPPGIFDDLINLQHIQLGVNQLRTLPKNIFQNLSSLEVLDLGFNLLTHLPEDVFLPLINLRVLDISRSSFVRLSAKHPFGRSKHLTKISAKFSNFVTWPMINWTEHSLTFVDFSRSNFGNATLPLRTPNRAIVDLSESNIKTIYIDTHEYGSNFPTYYLRNSNITCDCNLRQFVDFLNVNLETAAQIFPNLTNLECYEKKKKLLDITTRYQICSVIKDCPVDCKCSQDIEGILVNCFRKDMRDMPEILIEDAIIVDLTHNRISNVDPQLWMNVTRLYLSENSLTFIENLPSTVTYLSLNRNQLTRLPSSLMYRIDNWNELKILLAGNNWSCGCDSLFTKDWLTRNKHKIMDFANVSCMFGSDFSSFVQVISMDKCEEKMIYSVGWKTVLLYTSLIVLVLVFLTILFVYTCRRKRFVNNLQDDADNLVFINNRKENVEVVK
ncbi:platelet glycoprotein V-like [Centruroides vittatus]|uniref:platelet glycoprotein V-like n=1 Tax=Centruroides vittatus TaxID=120091 RepID=UPI00351067DB